MYHLNAPYVKIKDLDKNILNVISKQINCMQYLTYGTLAVKS